MEKWKEFCKGVYFGLLVTQLSHTEKDPKGLIYQ